MSARLGAAPLGLTWQERATGSQGLGSLSRLREGSLQDRVKVRSVAPHSLRVAATATGLQAERQVPPVETLTLDTSSNIREESCRMGMSYPLHSCIHWGISCFKRVCP